MNEDESLKKRNPNEDESLQKRNPNGDCPGMEVDWNWSTGRSRLELEHWSK